MCLHAMNYHRTERYDIYLIFGQWRSKWGSAIPVPTEAVAAILQHIHGIGTATKIREYNVARLINTSTRCVHIVGRNAYYHGSVLDTVEEGPSITGVSPTYTMYRTFCSTFFFLRFTQRSITQEIKIFILRLLQWQWLEFVSVYMDF